MLKKQEIVSEPIMLSIFTPVTSDEVRKEILNLDESKTTMHGNITADILKGSIEVHLNLIT